MEMVIDMKYIENKSIIFVIAIVFSATFLIASSLNLSNDFQKFLAKETTLNNSTQGLSQGSLSNNLANSFLKVGNLLARVITYLYRLT